MSEEKDLVDEFLRESVTAERKQKWRVRTIVAIAFCVVAIFVGIILLLLREPWQPVFGEDPVYYAVITDPNAPTYHFGTKNIGVGRISQDATPTTSRAGLPTGTPDQGIVGKDVIATELLAVDQHNPQKLLAYLYEENPLYQGLYRSNDGGITWHDSGLPLPDGYIIEMAIWEEVTLAVILSNVESDGLFAIEADDQAWELVMGRDKPPLTNVYTVYITPSGQDIYVGGEGGVYHSSFNRPWNWQLVVKLPVVDRIIGPVGDQRQPIYLTTPPTSTGMFIIYKWTPDNPPVPFLTVDTYPRSLAPHPDPDASTALFVLLDDGEVLVVDQDGQIESLGRKDGRGFTLLAGPHPTANRTWLLMAHEDGLLEYQDKFE